MTIPESDRNPCLICERGRWCAFAACLILVAAATGCGKPRQAAARPAAPSPASPSGENKPLKTPPPIVNAAPAAPKPEKVVVAPQPPPPPVTPPELVAEEGNPLDEPEVVAVIEPESLPEPEPAPVTARASSRKSERTTSEDDGCGGALVAVRREREANPGDLELRLEESRVLRACGRTDLAIPLLLDLSVAERTIADVAHEIADTFRMSNEPGRAAMAFELCYIRDPAGWVWAARAAEAWLEAGERATARWWYEKARGAAPESPEVRALGTTFQAASLRDR